jgi:hypothetical protein
MLESRVEIEAFKKALCNVVQQQCCFKFRVWIEEPDVSNYMTCSFAELGMLEDE